MTVEITKLHMLPLDEVIYSEAQLCEILGLSKQQVSDYRRTKKLPYLKVSETQRFYLGADVMDWMVSRRVILDKDS